MANQLNVPTLKDLKAFEVNRSDSQEVIRQSLYDFQTYDAANGHSTINFFQVPVGQSSKTLEDTNMEIAGSLPSPKRFLAESVEVFFFPGDDPSSFGAQAANDFVNDVYKVLKTGYLRLFIGSKDYLIEGPLLRFPQKVCFDFDSALSDATTAGSDAQSVIAYATAKGRPYRLQPPVLIPPTQNFKVEIAWPNGAQSLNSANDAKIGVVLDGLLYRLSQ